MRYPQEVRDAIKKHLAAGKSPAAVVEIIKPSDAEPLHTLLNGVPDEKLLAMVKYYAKTSGKKKLPKKEQRAAVAPDRSETVQAIIEDIFGGIDWMNETFRRALLLIRKELIRSRQELSALRENIEAKSTD